MKSYKVIHQSGSFTDVETGKRIILAEGEFIISGGNKSFREEIPEPAGSEVRLNAPKDYKYHLSKNRVVFRVADAHQLFAFRIGIKHMAATSNQTEFGFLFKALDDIYLYSSKPRIWRMCDCRVKLIKCFHGNISALQVEGTESESFNHLYSYVFNKYFPTRGSGTTNVFPRFFLLDEPQVKNLSIADIRGKGSLFTLDALREMAILHHDNYKNAKTKTKLLNEIRESKPNPPYAISRLYEEILSGEQDTDGQMMIF